MFRLLRLSDDPAHFHLAYVTLLLQYVSGTVGYIFLVDLLNYLLFLTMIFYVVSAGEDVVAGFVAFVFYVVDVVFVKMYCFSFANGEGLVLAA